MKDGLRPVAGSAGRSIVVTGASGMLGGAVAALLAAKGHRVRTFQRRPSGLAATLPIVRESPGGGVSGAGVSGASVSHPGASRPHVSHPGVAGPKISGADDFGGEVEDVLGSVTDRAAVERAVAGADAVIHLAAKVSFTGHRRDFEAINVGGTQNLLQAARAAGVKDFVFVSSPSVAHFGNSIVGAEAGTANPDLARGDYAQTKAAAELLALAETSPTLRVTAVRPHIVWGPGDTQLVERVVERARAGRLPLLDRGAALIDTTYIDNAAAAIVRALERMDQAQGKALVVTNGEPRPVGELLAGICRAAGVEPPGWSVPGSVARRAGAVIERAWTIAGARGWVNGEPPMTRFLAEQLSTAHWFDQRHTREVLDWEPEVSLDEGLARLAEHYRSRKSAETSH